MSDTQLRNDVQKLQELINQLPASDPQRQKLETLTHEMTQHLDQTSTAATAEQLRGVISHFETTHPTATAIINNILLTLANMGL